VFRWEPNASAPEPFATITNDFLGFFGLHVNSIYPPWINDNLEEVRRIWQRYLSAYSDLSFYAAIERGIPQWGTELMDAFGSLGLGSGGLGPMFSVDFVSALRYVLMQYPANQKLVLGGMDSFVRCFLDQQVAGTGRTVADQIEYDCRVTSLRYDQKTERTQLTLEKGGKVETREFDAVIAAASCRALEVIGLSLASRGAEPPVGLPAARAVRELHMTGASKLFIRTKTKFWLDDAGKPRSDMPQNIQTDQLPRGIYCLDYPQTSHGVVLLSYTWEDDSSTVLGLTCEERLRHCIRVVNEICPEFARELIPHESEPICIDWQREWGIHGAFQLPYPGQEPYLRDAYFQFQTVNDAKRDKGLYLAGDGVSWQGGWVEGAIQTGINAACAAAKRIGARVAAGSPLTQRADLYDYGD
jgi:tryptophan 2-monooxygenase